LLLTIQHDDDFALATARRTCRDIAVGVQVLPVEDEAGVAGELSEEGALGTAVALAERVDGVDLTQVVGQPLGENQLPFAMATVLICPAQS
jgi:hypothetical protein